MPLAFVAGEVSRKISLEDDSLVYHVPSVRQRCHSHETSFHAEASLTRWHLRFAHLNVPALKQMACQQVTTGMNCELNNDFDEPCWSCPSAKMTRKSY